MAIRASYPALLVLITLGLSAPALGKTIYASGDWSLDDSQPGIAGKGTCVAATATYLGNSGVYSFNVVLDKTGAHPLELMIRPFRSPSPVNRFEVSLRSGRAYGFVKLPLTAKSEDTFWNVPHGTDQLLTELKNTNQLTVNAVNGLGDLPFSLNGAVAVLAQLEKRCVLAPAFNNAQFEADFLPAAIDTIDFAQVDQPRAALLRDLVAKGTAAYHRFEEANAGLAAVEARRVALLQEQAALPGMISQITNKDLPALQKSRAEAQAAIDKASSEAAAAQAQVASRQGALAAAKAAAEAAAAKRKPYLADHERLVGQVQAGQTRLTTGQAALADLDQKLAKDPSDDLKKQRVAAAAEVAAAQQALSAATGALAAFEVKVKYPALEAEVAKAAGKLAAVQAEIAQFGDTVANRQGVARDQTSARNAIDQKITDANAAVVQKTKRIGEVKAALDRYPEDRQVAADKIPPAKQAVALASAALGAQIPQLAK